MKLSRLGWLAGIAAVCLWMRGEAAPPVRPVLYLQPNTTQLFTELYAAYGLTHPPQRTFFEPALYLDQSTYPSLVPMQLSNQLVFECASEVLSEFHRRMGDMELYIDPLKPKPFFYTASGSKQLIVALVYGMVMSEPDKKFLFVEQIPYYSGHPNAVSGLFRYPNARFLGFHDPSEVIPESGEILVEFVTSPNNPDGKFRRPLTSAEIIIADFVFASSAFGEDGTGYLDKNIEWVREARAAGKRLFSFNSASKQFGQTGTRCGYIWYPMADIYAASIFRQFFGFISSSTIGGGTVGLAEFLNLIQAFLDLPDAGSSLRRDAFKTLCKRHACVSEELLRRYPGSNVVSLPGSPTLFAEIRDPRAASRRAADLIFEDTGVVVNHGEPMGESNAFVRLNLSGYSGVLLAFLNRLAGWNKYVLEDVFSTSARVCNSSLVSAEGRMNSTRFWVHPGHCSLEVDASGGAVELLFPPFIDYEKGNVIRVRKIDASPNPVFIRLPRGCMALFPFRDGRGGQGRHLLGDAAGDQLITLDSKQAIWLQWIQPPGKRGFWRPCSPFRSVFGRRRGAYLTHQAPLLDRVPNARPAT